MWPTDLQGGNLGEGGMSCGHTPAIRCDGGGGPAGGGDLCLPPPEHSCTVYYDQAHYGLVSGGEADTGDTGIQAALGSGRDGCGGDANGGLGGRTERGAGGDGRDGDGDGQLIRWEYTVANVILGTEPNAPLAVNKQGKPLCHYCGDSIDVFLDY